MPALARLLAEGTWHRVSSPAAIGSGTVWPTFFTGLPPEQHGVYSYWSWNAETMSLMVQDCSQLVPFWQPLVRSGMSVGLLDVPFAPPVGVSLGFEVSEWGAHDIVRGRLVVSPLALRECVTRSVPAHPFMAGHERVGGMEDLRDLVALAEGCVAGARARGDLATRLIAAANPALTVIVFGEVHRAGHHLWHTVSAENAIYRDAPAEWISVRPNLVDVYQEVDRQIGRLVEACSPETTIFVFSLHGMQPARGLSTLLDVLMRDLDYASPSGFRRQSWAERGRSAVAAAKRFAPASVKKAYRRVLSHAARHRWTPPAQLPAYDWTRTRAFALPTDQHGWLRVNLEGREAAGIVAHDDYDRLCDELEAILQGFTTIDGRPLVRQILRPSRGSVHALTNPLPDLIVHWEVDALDSSARVNGRTLTTAPHALHLTGQHAADGFCIVRSATALVDPDATLAAQDLHRLITTALDPSARHASRPAF